MKIKKGDNVKVLSGKDRGSVGIVTAVFRSKERVTVEGVNKVKKHKKATANDSKKGIIEVEAPIHVSNVMKVEAKSSKPKTIKKASKVSDK